MNLVSFPEIRVGKALRHKALTVFPLFTNQANGLEYLVSDEALAGGWGRVETLREAGSMPLLALVPLLHDGHNDLNQGASPRRALDLQPTAEQSYSLPNTLQAEVPLLN